MGTRVIVVDDSSIAILEPDIEVVELRLFEVAIIVARLLEPPLVLAMRVVILDLSDIPLVNSVWVFVAACEAAVVLDSVALSSSLHLTGPLVLKPSASITIKSMIVKISVQQKAIFSSLSSPGEILRSSFSLDQKPEGFLGTGSCTVGSGLSKSRASWNVRARGVGCWASIS